MMKTVYIPKGETVSYESLVTERLVVEGCLKTAYGVKAKTISGRGVICADSVSADTIRMGEIECGTITCERLVAKRVEAPEVFASESVAVSCFLSAAYVETGRLTVAMSEIDEVVANEVINLPQKKHSMLGLLVASALRSLWAALTAPAVPVVDAEYRQIREETQENGATEETEPVDEIPAEGSDVEVSQLPEEQVSDTAREASKKPVDEELNRIVAIFNLLRDCGYTLRIVPGTPEENAPVFDFENQQIIRPAA